MSSEKNNTYISKTNIFIFKYWEMQLEPGQTYHIYNRGINCCNIFNEAKNYHFFLEKYCLYMPSVADTLAYCLLGNHFHFLIRIKDPIPAQPFHKPDGTVDLTKQFVPKAEKQLGHLFNTYAQAFNKMYGRHGGLFETPFRRKLITEDNYFTWLVWYIHRNPKHHGICKDFTSWPHSSYHHILQNNNKICSTAEILDWFGGREAFIEFHLSQQANMDEWEKGIE